MKKILLVCNAGMSTSILVRNMQKAAAEKGLDCSIEAKSLTQAKKELGDVNVILLGPQIGYELKSVKELAGETPAAVIDMKDYGAMDGMKDYGAMDGMKVLKTAYKLMKQAQAN